MRPLACLLLSLLLAVSGWADVAKGKEPPWVSAAAWTPPEAVATDGDYEDLLRDIQVNRATKELYVHFAFRYRTPKAVQDDSSLSIDYAPEYQSVKLHRLRLWRGGQIIDQMTAAFRSLQREKELEAALYSGTETWVGFLRNVRPGDVLEAAYTLAGDNPIFAGRYADSFALETGFAVRRWALRLLSPRGQVPAARTRGTLPVPVRTTLGSLEETVWAQDDVPSIKSEEYTPLDEQLGSRLVFSDWSTWESVVQWALPAYRFEPDAEVRALASRLTADREDPAEKAQALLLYVQNDIRYFGIEVGSNSHFPHSPEETLQNGYGDCKDKAVLFCALARAAGIEAWPVLVHTDAGRRVSEEGPTPLAFNHVIAAVKLDDTRFVDPTIAYQGAKFEHQILGDYRFGLELRAGAKDLTPLPGRSPSTRELQQDFWFKDYAGAGTIDMLFTYTGSDAVEWRARWSGMVESEWKSDTRERTHDDYGESTLESGPEVIDDPETNTFQLKYSIAATHLWNPKDGQQRLDLYPEMLRPLLYDPATLTVRRTPYGLEHPVRLTQVQRLHLPDDWNVSQAENPVNAPGFRVASWSTTTNPRLVVVVSTYESADDRVAPSEWKAYLDALQKARNEVSWYLTKDTTPAKTAQPKGLDTTTVGAIAVVSVLFLVSALSQGGDF